MNFNESDINIIQNYANNDLIGETESFHKFILKGTYHYTNKLYREIDNNFNKKIEKKEMLNTYINNLEKITNIRELSNANELFGHVYRFTLDLNIDKELNNIKYETNKTWIDFAKSKKVSVKKEEKYDMSSTSNYDNIIYDLEESDYNIEIIIKELKDKKLQAEDLMSRIGKIDNEIIRIKGNKISGEFKELVNNLKQSRDDFNNAINKKDELINEIKKDIEEFRNNYIDPIKEKVINKNPSSILNMAEKSELISPKEHTVLNDVMKFLKVKEEKDYIVSKIELTKSQNFEEIIILKDKSLILKSRDGYITPKTNGVEYETYAKKVAEDMVSFMLRKKPAFVNFFRNKMKEENYNLNGTLNTINSFIKNDQLLKNYNVNPQKEFKDLSLEKIDDFIAAIELKNNIKNFANSIISNKYKHLYNEKSYKYFKELYELKLPKESLQENIGKKVAGFQDSESFNKALKRYLDSLNGFSKESLIEKTKGLNVNKVYESDDMVIMKVNDFEASSKIGSASWCLSRTEHYFESYVTSPKNYQFFIFDYSKQSTDKDSMIGITLRQNGEFRAAHYKDDSEMNETKPSFLQLQKKIILNNKDLFNDLSNDLKELYKEELANKTNKKPQIN